MYYFSYTYSTINVNSNVTKFLYVCTEVSKISKIYISKYIYTLLALVMRYLNTILSPNVTLRYQ